MGPIAPEGALYLDQAQPLRRLLRGAALIACFAGVIFLIGLLTSQPAHAAVTSRAAAATGDLAGQIGGGPGGGAAGAVTGAAGAGSQAAAGTVSQAASAASQAAASAGSQLSTAAAQARSSAGQAVAGAGTLGSVSQASTGAVTQAASAAGQPVSTIIGAPGQAAGATVTGTSLGPGQPGTPGPGPGGGSPRPHRHGHAGGSTGSQGHQRPAAQPGQPGAGLTRWAIAVSWAASGQRSGYLLPPYVAGSGAGLLRSRAPGTGADPSPVLPAAPYQVPDGPGAGPGPDAHGAGHPVASFLELAVVLAAAALAVRATRRQDWTALIWDGRGPHRPG